MSLHVQVFSLITSLLLVLCLTTAWSRREKLYRWSILLVAFALIPGAYFTMTMLLSLPRDVSDEWYHKNATEALVSGVYVNEGVALYLYLVLPGMSEPRSYVFPWSDKIRELAQQLQEALGSPEGQGGVMITNPFQPSLETEKPLTVHPAPQERLPEKEQPRAPMMFDA